MTTQQQTERDADIVRQRRQRENSERVSREFNSYLIQLYNDGRRT